MKANNNLKKNVNENKIFAQMITYSCGRDDFIIKCIHPLKKNLLGNIVYEL